MTDQPEFECQSFATTIVPRTTNDLVRSIGWRYAFDINQDEADHILWEFTGYPSFWHGEPLASLTLQLHEYFVGRTLGLEPCARCGNYTFPGAFVCGPCATTLSQYASSRRSVENVETDRV